MSRYVIIVDPFSTGSDYAAAFRAAGLLPVAVLAPGSPIPAMAASWRPGDFEAVHAIGPAGSDLRHDARLLRQYDPVALVAGAETGVELCDALTELVRPGSGNDPATSAARRDKWRMAQALQAAGVPGLRQLWSTDPDEIARWITDSGLGDQPVVVKPAKSSATDHVHLVPPGGDPRPAFAQIHHRRNITGLINEGVLVQEFAAGTEYLVDTYSVAGRHGLVDVCRYTKSRQEDRLGLYNRVEFLPPDHPEVDALAGYTRDVLDALGIRNGCGHTEVVLTAAGPRLLETAARPAGGGHQVITHAATGDNQIRRTVAHRARGAFTPGYQLRQHLSAVFLSAPEAGRWVDADRFDRVELLPSFHSQHLPYGTGDLVPATRDLVTTLGWVILAHADAAVVEADVATLAELERRITIEPACDPTVDPTREGVRA